MNAKKIQNSFEFHPANKKRIGEWLITRVLIQPAASRAFKAIYAYVDPESLRLRDEPGMPLIVCLAHTGWWDGYMTLLLNRRVFGRDSYLMMEEANLARFWFFTWIGVYGVDRDDPTKAIASLDYSANLLTGAENRAVWIFPQGTITHPDKRPLGLYGGASHIASKVGRCAIVPIALRYEFRMEQAPEVFARVGSPIIYDSEKHRLSTKETTARLDSVLTATDDALHADLVSGDLHKYRIILLGRSSASAVWDGFLRRIGGGSKTTLEGS